MPFQIIRNDITNVRADAIVNTANPEPIFASGTDGAIYHAAGADALLAERKKIGYIEPGEAAVTAAFALPARFIIHTVGPAWVDGKHGEYELLSSCYRKSLLLARQLGCESIAFPLISTGVYGFPKDRALNIALHEISLFLEDADMDVILVVFDRKAFDLSSTLVADVGQYIDENYVAARHKEEYFGSSYPGEFPDAFAFEEIPEENEHPRRRSAPSRRFRDVERMEKRRSLSGTLRDSIRNRLNAGREEQPAPAKTENDLPVESSPVSNMMASDAEPHYPEAALHMPSADKAASSAPEASRAKPAAAAPAAPAAGTDTASKHRSLQDVVSHVGETFQECLLRMIDERGFTDAQVYKRANIDRKLFSKIRCNPGYIPRRKTVISLAIALELNLDETTDLLRKAGIALSPGCKFDLIIRYCLENRIYDTMEINAILFDYHQPQLGA